MPERDELLKYYIKHADTRFDKLENKMDKLVSFRWILIGVSLAISGMVSFVFQLLEVTGRNK